MEAIIVDNHSTIKSLTDRAAVLCGIPEDILMGSRLTDHTIPDHTPRLSAELEAIAGGLEKHGRVRLTITGADGIGRTLDCYLSRDKNDDIRVSISPYDRSSKPAPRRDIRRLDAARLLPVTRRLTGLARRATSREELLRGGLEILAEVTDSESAAALEWEFQKAEHPPLAYGPFNDLLLRGVFRPAIMSRLTRGDVILKDASLNGETGEISLIILPLLSSATPVAIIVLVTRHTNVLAPEEQQSLVILGEIIGLGLKALAAHTQVERGQTPRKGDTEATIALGRLSAGLTHEINNAVTVLQNYLTQLHPMLPDMPYPTVGNSAIKDSMTAIDAVRDLTEALRAFAPEETALLEETDILRVLDMVVRSVRFYSKRGIGISLERPTEPIPHVEVRSHHLIRSLFLVFVELIEASRESGLEVSIALGLTCENGIVNLSITVTSGPFSLPSVLLAQLERGGALARHVARAGGSLTYAVDHEGNLAMNIEMCQAAQSDNPKQSLAPFLSIPPTRRGTILIVDDEMAVIRSLRRLWEKDHDVLAARSGDEALSIIRSSPHIDIVLYDVSMPRLGGKEFYEEIERHHMPIATRIIFVSSGASDSEITAFLMKTGNPIVEKPFDLELLGDLIGSLIQ